MTRPRSRRPVTVGVAAVVLAVAGCADIPDSGPVTRVGAESSAEDDVDTVFDPSGPRPGATPVEIVQGFYDAMLDNPISTATAEEFLTELARKDWEPTRRTVIYRAEVRPRQLGPGRVEARISKLGALDDRGRYRPAPPAQPDESSQLLLRMEGGQWRIANPPDAMYVDGYFFERSYDPFSLYFLGPSDDLMVPEPIYLPTDLQPATELVRGVLEGPPPSWRGQLGTAVPSLTELKGSVPITDEVAEVRLVGPILDLSAEAQRLMSAQIVLTLSQLPGLDGVRIFAGGVTLASVPAVQDVDQWNEFDQTSLLTRDRLYALQSGRLVQVNGREVSRPLPDSLWGTRRQGIRSFDVDVDLEQVLAVSADGHRLLSGPLYESAGQEPRTRYTGGQDLATPVATLGPEWMVVDRRRNGTSRLLISDGNTWWDAPMRGLRHYRVESLALSPDGMRFAAVARSATPEGFGVPRIMTGKVSRSSDGARAVDLIEPQALVISDQTLDDISSVGWYDATTLAVLGRRDGPAELEAFTVRIDGSELATAWIVPETDTDASTATVDPTRLLTSVGVERRAYLDYPRGEVWVEVEGRWVQVEAAGLEALNFAG